MSFDIYGNTLRSGHCEVHPHVHEEYPCSVCIAEASQREQQQRPPYCDGDPRFCESAHYLAQASEHIKDQERTMATQQARIEALEAERRWMPFEKPEQLPQTMWAPNYSDPILVAILSGKTRFVRDDRYDFVQDRWDSGCVGVTHWMPLPEPPEAEK